MEFGSIPFLNDWLREAIRSVLSTYVAPRYVNIDVAELLNRQVNLGPTQILLFRQLLTYLNRNKCRDKSDPMMVFAPSIDNLRRRTRAPIACPRTATPRGIAITSVADQLESRHSSLAPGSELIPSVQEEALGNVQILKPVTELSRLALDRHALKKDNLVRPLTELARMGMDRWLNSTVMTRRTRAEREGTSNWEEGVQVDFHVPDTIV